MSAIEPVVVGLLLLLPVKASPSSPAENTACLEEKLRDRLHALHQSQAALLLVQSTSAEAEEVVRRGLQQRESPEMFMALAGALRLSRDKRFIEELFDALGSSRLAIRQEASETLAILADTAVVRRLQLLVEDDKGELSVRQTAMWTLGRSGRKSAAVILLDQLSNPQTLLRRTAAEALAELTGHNCGENTLRWRAWWDGHKEVAETSWMAERLAYQASRARRLEGELERAKTQVVRLHQHLYARLPAADRLGHVQSLADHEDAAARGLAVTWSVELLPGADAVGQRSLAEVLLRLSHDGVVEVQRPAVLALGRVSDVRAYERLRLLVKKGKPPVRAAAARALAQQTNLAKPGSAEARALQRQVIPILQKALEDSAIEVVVEAAEGLGTLGLPEAAPVLTALLRHVSEPVRLTAAQSLERVADAAVLNELLAALDDTAVTVRFSVIGALGHAAGNGRLLSESARVRLCARLEEVLARDTDPGVRSRAASVLGECGTPTVLPALWKRLQAAEDGRVQDKAWTALTDILARAASIDLLHQWDQKLLDDKQGTRRLQLLTDLLDAWKKNPENRALVGPVTEMLVQAQLDQSKWTSAFPLVRELLVLPGTDTEAARRLRWLLTVGELALKEGNRAEALRAVQDAQQFLPRLPSLSGDFEKLEKQAKKK